MDARQFLAEFGHIANAPGGMARLRGLVLHLAITGRLVQQLPTDEHAEILLERMKLAASKLYSKKRRELKKQHNERQVFKNNSLPNGWALVDLGDLGDWGAGSTPSRSNSTYYGGGIPWFKSGELKADYITKSEECVSELALKECSLRINSPGDVLIAMYGANIGQASIVEVKSTTNQAICACTPHEGLNNRFLLLLLRALQNYFINLGTGGAQPNISKEKIVATSVGLPPAEEQSRIVAKVDELMALCDKLETQQQQRRSLQNNLRQSTLQAVVASTTPHELQLAWTFLEENFSRLFQVPEDVDEFIANIKDLAVLGLLARVTNDQPDLSEIISACSALRSEYVSAGLMRKQKLILNVEPVELNYPEHWSVVPFDEVAVVIGGVTKGRDLRGKDVVTCSYLSVANVQRGFFKLDQLKTIQITKAELTKYQVLEGDLLITEGGDWDKVGRTAIWKGGIDNCLHQNHVFKARVPSKQLLNEWVELIFNSGIGRNYFAGASKQTTNLASINMTQLRSFPLPIPPLAEQRNILKNLDALTIFCQSWRNQLEHKQKLATLLATAVTSSFTGIRNQEEDEPMKAPKTELIAPLRLGIPPSTKEQGPLAAILAHQNGEMAAKDLWQRFGGEIDAFYAQLKLEVDKGWILEPEVAKMRQLETA